MNRKLVKQGSGSYKS